MKKVNMILRHVKRRLSSRAREVTAHTISKAEGWMGKKTVKVNIENYNLTTKVCKAYRVKTHQCSWDSFYRTQWRMGGSPDSRMWSGKKKIPYHVF